MSVQPPTRLPSSRFEEEPLLVIGGFKMSLRQMGWIALGFIAWGFLGKFLAEFIGLGNLIGFGLTLPFALAGPLFAWVKIEGRPLEMWVADRLIYRLEKREYTLGDESRSAQIFDTRWEDE